MRSTNHDGARASRCTFQFRCTFLEAGTDHPLFEAGSLFFGVGASSCAFLNHRTFWRWFLIRPLFAGWTFGTSLSRLVPIQSVYGTWASPFDWRLPFLQPPHRRQRPDSYKPDTAPRQNPRGIGGSGRGGHREELCCGCGPPGDPPV